MKLPIGFSLFLLFRDLLGTCHGFVTPLAHKGDAVATVHANSHATTFLASSTDSDATMTTDEVTNNPRKLGLALQLDNGTRKSHSMAQNTAFVTGFFKGLANRQSYGALLKSLYFVYDAMEKAMDETSQGRH